MTFYLILVSDLIATNESGFAHRGSFSRRSSDIGSSKGVHSKLLYQDGISSFSYLLKLTKRRVTVEAGGADFAVNRAARAVLSAI